jgi:hypothetical protein
MCWSTGRAPMAHPPGRLTRARPEARNQRSQHEDRRAHRLHQLVRRFRPRHRRGVDADGGAVALGHHTHLPQQLQRSGNILQLGHVADDEVVRAEQPGAENRQRGVLGAGDRDLALERRAAAYLQLVHVQGRIDGRSAKDDRPRDAFGPE